MTASPAIRPIDRDEAAALFAPLAGRSLLIGWSGGPDSTALAGLMADWGREHNATVAAATVDHGLRPESRREAEGVAAHAEEHGLSHRVLIWDGAKPATGIQQAAREARYRLLAEEARRIGADTIVTAHTLDDQAETILMRMARGSGLDGLRGMRPMTSRDGLALARPLLGVSKTRLIATCEARDWDYLRDPSNSDPRFSRSRWRDLMPLLAAEGLTPERLALFAQRAGATQDALRWETRRWDQPVRRWKESDPITYNMARYVVLPTPYIVCFLLDLIERHAPGRSVRLERCEALAARLHGAMKDYRWFRANIAGLQITHRRDSYLTIEPEPPRRRGRPED